MTTHRTILRSAAFILMMLPVTLYAQLMEDRVNHQLVLEGIDRTLRQDYAGAEMSFRRIIARTPDHPAGYLYLAGMLQAKNTDYGDLFNEQQYDSLLNTAERLAEPLIADPRYTASGYYFRGAAQAFRSYTRSENGNIASSVYYGLSAGTSLERCLEADREFVQAKDILGSFYFWKSKLAWIPFVSDKRKEGIAMIKESYVHPYEKHLASHNLMVILTEEKEFAEAERYGIGMLTAYPDNRLFLWNLMTLYEQWNRPSEMLSAVRRLLASTLAAPVTNRYTEAVCRIKLAKAALAGGDAAAARTELRTVLSLRRFIPVTQRDLRKKITQAEQLLSTIP